MLQRARFLSEEDWAKNTPFSEKHPHIKLVLTTCSNDSRQEPFTPAPDPTLQNTGGRLKYLCGGAFLFSVFSVFVQVDKKKAIKEAKAKAPKADQFAQSKMKAEIINPYKQNWILVISIAIGAAKLHV